LSQESEAQSALLLSDSILEGREIVVSKSQRAITQKKPTEPAAASSAGAKTSEDKPKAAAAPAAALRFAPQLTPMQKQGLKRRLQLDEPSKAEKAEGAAGEEEPAAKGGKVGDTAGKVAFRTARTLKQKEDPQPPSAAAAAPPSTAAAAAASGAASGAKAAEEAKPAEAEAKPMSNSDFRALFLAGMK